MSSLRVLLVPLDFVFLIEDRVEHDRAFQSQHVARQRGGHSELLNPAGMIGGGAHFANKGKRVGARENTRDDECTEPEGQAPSDGELGKHYFVLSL